MTGKRFPFLLLFGVLATGCAGSEGIEFKEALVLYRNAFTPGGDAPIFIGFINENHPRYVVEGNVRPDIPGKPLPDDLASRCLGRLAEWGYPEDWTPAGNLRDALALRPRDHILVAEVDGEVRVRVRGTADADGESQRLLRGFVNSKKALIEVSGYRTGFRVVPNKEGASLFDRQREKITRSGSRGKK